jgi:hypothetical protein
MWVVLEADSETFDKYEAGLGCIILTSGRFDFFVVDYST